MARPQNPQRKPQLLEDILAYLQDKNLADLSFRPLAEALGISSYMLVYHFGHREQLLEEIVQRVEADLSAPSPEQLAGLAVPELRQLLLQVWEQSQKPHSRALQRLGFEASIQQAAARHNTDPAPPLRPPGFVRWRDAATGWLRARGAGEQTAAAEGTLFAAGVCGLWFGQVVADQAGEPAAAFSLLLERFLAAAA